MKSIARYRFRDEDAGNFLSDGEFAWITMCREGDWPYDKARGHLKITEQTIDNFIKNFKENVRGMSDESGHPILDIDYDHKEFNGKAAGWIVDLRKSEKTLADGRKVKVLEGKPDWTPDAQEAIKKGEYKGYSIEFDDWKNPETGKLYKDVLFGGAVTNRPYVKNMPAITLSEEIDTEIPIKEERRMKLIKKVLSEINMAVDGTDEYVDEKAAEAIKMLSDKVIESDNNLTIALKERDDTKKALTDIQPKIDKLAELEKAEDVRAKEDVMKCAEGKISPAQEKDEKHWFSIMLKEKRYAEAKAILADMKKFKDKKGDEDEGEAEAESGRSDNEKEHLGAIKYMQKAKMPTDINDEHFHLNYKAAIEAVRAKNAEAGRKSEDESEDEDEKEGGKKK